MTSNTSIKLALVDDHKLFRKGLVSLIDSVLINYKIVFEADDGLDLQAKLTSDNQPDIILMDINMPKLDGYDTAKWLRENFPLIKILVVSMIENEESIVRMLKMGVRGYLSKDVEPNELGAAIHSLSNKGFYYTDFITGKLVHSLQNPEGSEPKKDKTNHLLNDREKDFIQYACTEMTYNEIAKKMFVSPKTVDGYRKSLFEKLSVKNRVGLVIYAIRCGLVTI